MYIGNEGLGYLVITWKFCLQSRGVVRYRTCNIGHGMYRNHVQVLPMHGGIKQNMSHGTITTPLGRLCRDSFLSSVLFGAFRDGTAPVLNLKIAWRPKDCFIHDEASCESSSKCARQIRDHSLNLKSDLVVLTKRTHSLQVAGSLENLNS